MRMNFHGNNIVSNFTKSITNHILIHFITFFRFFFLLLFDVAWLTFSTCRSEQKENERREKLSDNMNAH